MPTKLEALSLRSIAGSTAYPWSSWFDGVARRFVRGADFDSSPNTFRKRAYDASERMGVKIETRLGDTWVELQAWHWQPDAKYLKVQP